MSRPRLLILVVVAVVVAAILVWRPWARGAADASSTASTSARPAATPVYAQEVRAERLREEVVATGVVRAEESIDLRTEISGRIVRLDLEEGQLVQHGAVLVQLDDAERQAELDRAEQRVELARVQEDRQRLLLGSEGISQQEYDQAVSETKVLEAELSLTRAQHQKTRLQAPFTGVIGLRYVSVGALVDPSTRIATLQKLDDLKVDFSVAERHMATVAVGAAVRIEIAGQPEPLEGEVAAIEPQIDPATRTIQLRALVPNPGRILPGAFATVTITLREIPDALLIPATALVPELNAQRVFIVVEGRAESREITLGLRQARHVQVTSGLQAGDLVITSGQTQLSAGDAVEPLDRPSTEQRASSNGAAPTAAE